MCQCISIHVAFNNINVLEYGFSRKMLSVAFPKMDKDGWGAEWLACGCVWADRPLSSRAWGQSSAAAPLCTAFDWVDAHPPSLHRAILHWHTGGGARWVGCIVHVGWCRSVVAEAACWFRIKCKFPCKLLFIQWSPFICIPWKDHPHLCCKSFRYQSRTAGEVSVLSFNFVIPSLKPQTTSRILSC